MTRAQFWITFSFVVTMMPGNALACTGADAPDDVIRNSPEMRAVVAYLDSTFRKNAIIKYILHSGREVLDLDEAVIARAECRANYIHIYFEGGSRQDLHCMTSIEVFEDATIVVEDGAVPLACRIDGGEADLVLVPIDPN